MSNQENRVYFDVQIADHKVGRIVCELRTSELPRSCHMIRQLCVKQVFKGTTIDTIVQKEYVQGFLVAAESFVANNVSFVHNESGFEKHLVHDTFGLLSMCTNEEDGSVRLSFTVKESQSLPEEGSIVIGQVVKGMGVVKRCEYVPVEDKLKRPTVPIVVVGCGALERDEEDGVSPLVSTDGDLFPEYVNDFSSVIEHRIAASMEIRKIGNEYFKAGDNVNALKKYEKAFRYLAPGLCSFEETQELDREEIIVLGNMAAVKHRTKEYYHVREICTKILQLDRKNVKALYRRGHASLMMGDLDQAKEDLQTALSADDVPESEMNAIRSLLQKTEVALSQLTKKEKAAYSKLFA